MTLVEQITNDLDYDGMELEVNVWRGGKLETLSLIWNGERYVIK